VPLVAFEPLLAPLFDGDLRVPRGDVLALHDARRLLIKPPLRLRFDLELLRVLAAVAVDVTVPATATLYRATRSEQLCGCRARRGPSSSTSLRQQLAGCVSRRLFLIYVRRYTGFSRSEILRRTYAVPLSRIKAA
jgi:hypothetical protein